MRFNYIKAFLIFLGTTVGISETIAQCVISASNASRTICTGTWITFVATSNSTAVNHHVWYDQFGNSNSPTSEEYIRYSSTQTPIGWTSSYTVYVSGNATFQAAPSCNTSTRVSFSVSYNNPTGVGITMGQNYNPSGFCAGEVVRLTATGGSGSYSWKRDATSLGGGTYVDAAVTGTYTVTSNNSCGQPSSSSIAMKFSPVPADFSIIGSTQQCQGTGVGQFTAMSYGATNYRWSIGGVSVPSVPSGPENSITSVATPDISSDYSGTFVLSAIADGCHGTSATASINVTVRPFPTSTQCPISGSEKVGCAGAVILSATSNSSSIREHRWYDSEVGGNGIAVTNQGRADHGGAWVSELKVYLTENTEYWVEPVCDCSTYMRRALVKFTLDGGSNLNLSMTPAATNPMDLCQGQNVSLTASEGSDYKWRYNDRYKITPDYTSATISPTQSGTYYVTSVNSCNQTRENSITLNFNPALSPLSVTSSHPNFCFGSPVSETRFTAEVNNSNAVTWHMYAPGKTTAQIGESVPGPYNTYSVEWNPEFVGSAYFDVVAYGCNHSTKTVTRSFSIYPYPDATISPAGNVSVPYGSDYVTLAAVAGNTYQWYKEDVIQEDQTGNSFDARNSGSYKVKVTSPNSCTTTSLPVAVNFLNNYNYITENVLLADKKNNNSIIKEPDVLDLDVDRRTQVTTYFDGLGRPTQAVMLKNSPGSDKKDIVQIMETDDFNREAKKYLPYTSSENNGWFKADPLTAQSTFYSSTPNVATSGKPFAVTTFEPSPLNRVIKQGAPGETWQPDPNRAIITDKVIRKEYEFNKVADAIYVFRYDDVAGKVITTNEIYGDNKLHKNRTYDEVRHIVLDFVDKQGRLVCKQTQSGGSVESPQFASTYFVYDNLDNLIMVIPPEGFEKLKPLINGN